MGQGQVEWRMLLTLRQKPHDFWFFSYKMHVKFVYTRFTFQFDHMHLLMNFRDKMKRLKYKNIRNYTSNTVLFFLCVCGFMINDISELQQLATPQSPKQSSLAGSSMNCLLFTGSDGPNIWLPDPQWRSLKHLAHFIFTFPLVQQFVCEAVWLKIV